MIEFKVSRHMVRGAEVEVMEIWIGTKMVATIYPQPPNTIRLLSNHLYRASASPVNLQPAIHEFEFYPR